MTHMDGDVHWKQPRKGTIKINMDAAIFENFRCYSYAMLARDHECKMMEAVSKYRQENVEPEFAEVMEIKETLSWEKSKSWSNVVIETDCLVVTHVIRSSTTNLSYLGRVVDDCKAE